MHAALGRLTGGISPVALSLAYSDWIQHLVLSPDKHIDLLEFFPKLEMQKALFRIIDQFRKNNK